MAFPPEQATEKMPMNRHCALSSLAIFGIIAAAYATTNQPINICDGVVDKVFVADITDCQKYFICMNGEAIPQKCNNNYYFNGDTQSCVASNTSCLTCTPEKLSTVALARTCNKYALCLDGTPFLGQCADDLQFNPLLSACDYPQNVDCVANQCSIYANNVTYVSSKASCSKYYICMRGQPQAQTCVSNLVFNPNISKCDLPANYKCAITAPGKARSLQTAAMIAPRLVDINCPSVGIKQLAHENPNQYYMCANGKGALMTCAANLYFDVEMGACRRQEDILKKH